METQLFPLGLVVVTNAAADALDGEDVQSALRRHHSGDWGELGDEDRRQNEIALQRGRRLFSVYRDRSNIKFYIITEANRGATTVLLPEEY